jgi:hypothetical protein
MQAALRALNQLATDHVIERYAIGGAIGAAFYIEAVQTEDIDAFIFLAPSAGGLLSLSPVYDALVALGGKVEGEYVRFDDRFRYCPTPTIWYAKQFDRRLTPSTTAFPPGCSRPNTFARSHSIPAAPKITCGLRCFLSKRQSI